MFYFEYNLTFFPTSSLWNTTSVLHTLQIAFTSKFCRTTVVALYAQWTWAQILATNSYSEKLWHWVDNTASGFCAHIRMQPLWNKSFWNVIHHSPQWAYPLYGSLPRVVLELTSRSQITFQCAVSGWSQNIIIFSFQQ